MPGAASRKELTAGEKVFLAFAAVLSVINLVDFMFYGWRLLDLVVAVGFALIAYGTYRNGLTGFGRRNETPVDRTAQYASGIGVAMALGAFVVEHLL